GLPRAGSPDRSTPRRRPHHHSLRGIDPRRHRVGAGRAARRAHRRHHGGGQHDRDPADLQVGGRLRHHPGRAAHPPARSAGRADVIGYLTAIATLVGIRALLALGLNVQWGMTGLVNLGVVAFFAIGAYTSGLLAVSGVALPLAWTAALVTRRIAGAACAVAALPLPEDYLAIVTLGFGEVLRLFLLNEAWLTRGANGITGIPRPLHAWVPARYDLFYLALVVIAVFLTYLALERVRRSPFGRVLRAIREDETVAAVAGKTVVRFKVQAFVIGAVVAGLAGVLFGHYLA